MREQAESVKVKVNVITRYFSSRLSLSGSRYHVHLKKTLDAPDRHQHQRAS